jgi:hypothetical protein
MHVDLHSGVARSPLCLLRRYVGRLVALGGVMLIIVEQYLEPTIANSLVPLRQLNWPHMIGAPLHVICPSGCYSPRQAWA